jgi:hypothetical protein
MKYPEKYKNTKEEDYIEAEIVDDYSNSQEKQNKSNFEFEFYNNYKLFDKLKFKFSKTFFLISLTISLILLTLGAFLSSTLIGAIFGIPLIILGMLIIIFSVKLMRFFS